MNAPVIILVIQPIVPDPSAEWQAMRLAAIEAEPVRFEGFGD